MGQWDIMAIHTSGMRQFCWLGESFEFCGSGEPIEFVLSSVGLESPSEGVSDYRGPRDLEPDEFKRAHQICAFFCGFGEPIRLLWVWRAHQKFRGLGVSDYRAPRDLEPDEYKVYYAAACLFGELPNLQQMLRISQVLSCID